MQGQAASGLPPFPAHRPEKARCETRQEYRHASLCRMPRLLSSFGYQCKTDSSCAEPASTRPLARNPTSLASPDDCLRPQRSALTPSFLQALLEPAGPSFQDAILLFQEIRLPQTASADAASPGSRVPAPRSRFPWNAHDLAKWKLSVGTASQKLLLPQTGRFQNRPE